MIQKTPKSNVSSLNIIGERRVSTLLSFIVSFIYGSLLLMVSYTQAGVRSLLDISPEGMIYVLVAQFSGLFLGAFLVSFLIRKINMRWIFSSGFLIATIALVFILFIDKIFLYNGFQISKLITYILVSLIFGASIGVISPLVATYFVTAYKQEPHKKATLLSCSSGLYGIGAGILPLIGASFVIKTGNEHFNNVRDFYIVAIILGIIGTIVGFFINYKPSINKVEEKRRLTLTRKNNIIAGIIFITVVMSCYMIIETTSNYMFKNIADKTNENSQGHISTNSEILIIESVGFFFIVQGVWKIISGLFLVKITGNFWFLIFSSAIFFISLILITLNLLNHPAVLFLTAGLMGIGLGNMWSIIFSYGTSLSKSASAAIGSVLNMDSAFFLIITTLINGTLWNLFGQSKNSFKLYSPIIMSMIVVIILIIFLIMYKLFMNKINRRKNVEKLNINL